MLATLFMYLLWVAAIVALLATTFTNFQYIDLNAIAGVLLMAAIINTMIIAARNEKK